MGRSRTATSEIPVITAVFIVPSIANPPVCNHLEDKILQFYYNYIIAGFQKRRQSNMGIYLSKMCKTVRCNGC